MPTLVDGNYVLWDSHAITAYLVDKYGKDDTLYPKDLQKRGTVNQRLHLDDSIVSGLIRGIGVYIKQLALLSSSNKSLFPFVLDNNFLWKGKICTKRKDR